MKRRESGPSDPLWYKDAVFYELRVRSFYDSNGDGVGDFPGLTQKLEYLQSLGVTTLWLLPFYPSPMRDDGYDISNYTDVHADCGTQRSLPAGSSSHFASKSGSLATTSRRTTEPSPSTTQIPS